MKLLEDRILKEGVVRPGGVLKVDSFLNHQMDMRLFREMAKEWKRLYEGCGVNKILTIEASGIGMASIAAEEFDCPLLFAKKSKTINIANEIYTADVASFTHGRVYKIMVSQDYIGKDDKVLIIDDFLANGEALMGLIAICRQAGAEVIGAGVAIEKTFQPGGKKIRDLGVRVESLARIASMTDDSLTFCD